MKSDFNKNAAATHAAYWRRTKQLTALLLGIWFAATFGVIFFARELSGRSLFGWSFSYYMAAQGTIFIYVIIVGAYAWRMARLDETLEDEDKDKHGDADVR